MKWFKRMPIWILAICAFLIFCGFDENGQKVYDNANLFTDREEERLQELCVQMAQQEELDVIIYTTNSMNGMSDVDFAEKIYRQYGFGYDGQNGAGILLLIDMESRVVYIHESQLEENPFLFLDSELDRMIDKITPYLSNADYFGGAKKFIDLIPQYSDLEDVKDEHAYDGSGDGRYDTDGRYEADRDYWLNPVSIFTRLVVAAMIAGIAVAVMHFQQRSKKVTDGRVYLKDKRFDVRERSDVFTHTTVSKRRIEHESSSGGGGGGGGHHGGSHSGGGSHSHGRGGGF